MKTAKLIGGAGTGKTHRLMLTLDRLRERGVDSLDIGFVTFTRPARSEAVARASERFKVPEAKLQKKGWFRTVHSVCHRLLGVSDELLTDNRESRQWVAEALGEPVEVLGADLRDEMAPRQQAKTDADKALGLWGHARSRLLPFEPVYREAEVLDGTLPPLDWCVKTIDQYEDAKRNEDRCDFDDLLLRIAGLRCWTEGVENTEPEGEMPALTAVLHDEAQDISPLSNRVWQRIIAMPSVKWAYLAGDPWQSIFGYAGADHHILLDHPADKTEIMPQSWRCPAPILALGERILSDCSDYFDRQIKPAGHHGQIDERGIAEFAAEVDPRQSWLILARSNRMARDLQKRLDAAGVPWMPTSGNGGWQPTIRTNALDTLTAMQRGEPIACLDWRDVVKTIPATGRLVRGAKTQWAATPPAKLRSLGMATPDDWSDLGITDEYAAKIRSGAWIDDINAGDYVSAVKHWGQKATSRPGVRVGTIHSAKGAESDNVALLTSLPYPTARALAFDDHRDAEQRVFYVGVSRARHRLVIVNDPRADYKKRLPL